MGGDAFDEKKPSRFGAGYLGTCRGRRVQPTLKSYARDHVCIQHVTWCRAVAWLRVEEKIITKTSKKSKRSKRKQK